MCANLSLSGSFAAAWDTHFILHHCIYPARWVRATQCWGQGLQLSGAGSGDSATAPVLGLHAAATFVLSARSPALGPGCEEGWEKHRQHGSTCVHDVSSVSGCLKPRLSHFNLHFIFASSLGLWTVWI